MKIKKFKKYLAAMMAGMMTMSMFSGVALADEPEAELNEVETKQEVVYKEVDSYVIYHGAKGDTDYAFTQTWWWVTPYLPSFSTRGSNPTYEWPIVYNMVNTAAVVEGKTVADGPYASIPVYCTDILTGTDQGTNYRRINLEDSTYYSEDYAGRIRSILTNSFPHVMDMEALAQAVNAWLGKEAVVGLTTAEALTATQDAIWLMSNSDECELYEYCMAEDTGVYSATQKKNQIIDVTTVNPDAVDNRVNPDDDVNPATEQTIQNIESLCKYLLSLEAMKVQDSMISEHSLKDVTVFYVDNLDGTYDVTVSYVVDATIHKDDKLSISAACGNVRKTYALTEAGADSITLTVETLGEVSLEINGVQNSTGDVYLYEPIAGRRTAQSMVGYDTSAVPVHAEVIVTERVLNFHKTTNTDQGKKALENVAFDIYLITENVAGFAAGELTLPANPKADYAADTRTFVTTVKTDAQGKAVCNLTQLNFGDGIYLVVEQNHPAVVRPIDPFFVCVPMTNEEGTGYNYNINIEPKNTVVPGPEICHDVTEIENDHDSFNVNEDQLWIIRATIPADLSTAKEYKITNVLDYRLTYKGNLEVKVAKETDAANTEEVTLVRGTDYKLIVDKTSTDGKVVDKFVVSLTAAGMKKVAEATVNKGRSVEEGSDAYEVRVYFDALINTNAGMGALIPNQATLDYTNSFGYEYDLKSDITDVYTCGIQIFKYDAKTKAALSDAVFKLAKEAVTDAEKAIAAKLVVSKGVTKDVVYVDFYATADMSEAKTNVVTTDVDGAAIMYGLEDGTYYLVETKAPAGYNMLSYPVEVVLNRGSHVIVDDATTEANEDMTVRVANSNTFHLPETGGIGTVIFTVSGGLMTLAGGTILALKKREEE